MSIHSLFKVTRSITGKSWSEIRIYVNHVCHFCNTVFAELVHVNCVKFSIENDKWKVNIGMNKHYVGIRTSSRASISYFGNTLTRVLPWKSYRIIKNKFALIGTQNLTSIFSTTNIDRANRFSPIKTTFQRKQVGWLSLLSENKNLSKNWNQKLLWSREQCHSEFSVRFQL